jgi:hypothetical protein
MTGIFLLIFRLLLTASLFLFLGWALWVLWRSLSMQSSQVSALKTPTLSLTVQETDTPAWTHSFSSPDITIGREPGCECILSDDTISLRHARLSYHHSQWWIQDLQSTNGTLLNDEKLKSATVIVSGDEIVCGQSVLIVSIEEH